MTPQPLRLGYVLIVGAALFGAALPAVTAQTNELVVSAGPIFRYGDARDLDCTVQMNIMDELATAAERITDIRIHRAVDDTGKDLTRRNNATPPLPPSRFGKNSGRVFNQSGWMAILNLKSPGATAKTIREIRGEIDLAVPTWENGGLLRITNFMAAPGRVIKAANLAQHGIKLTFHTLESYTDFQRANPKQYVDATDLQIERRCFSGIYGSPTNPPRNSVAIQVEDPNRVLLGFGFETKDGTRADATTSYSLPNFRCYRFAQPPPADLNLIVSVAAPGVVQTRPFALENVWLPWDRSPGSPYLDPPDLRATAELQIWERKNSTNAYLHLTLIGGPIPQADGIRRVRFMHATDASGNPIPLTPRAATDQLTPVEYPPAPVRAQTTIFLGALPSVTGLKSLEGEVEVFTPTAENGGMLVLSNLLAFSGKVLPLPPAMVSATKIHFAGLVHFGEQEAALRNTAGIISQGSLVANPTNSLRFEMENPEAYFVRLEIRDPDGGAIHPVRTLRSGNIAIYNFREAPGADWQVAVYLATPEAMRIFPFRAENVPVGVTASTANSLRRSGEWQSETEHRAAVRLVARTDAPAVVGDDFLADGQPETGAMVFAVRDEWFKQPGHDFGRESGTGIGNLGDKFALGLGETQRDGASGNQRFGGVVGEIVKQPPHRFRVQVHARSRRRVGQDQAGGL